MSQEKLILNHLKQGHSLTALDALIKFDCLRLAARIHDLRATYDIHSKTVKDGDKSYSEYTLLTGTKKP